MQLSLLRRLILRLQEMFVRYLAEQAHNVVKSERKPRRNIQYKDLGTFDFNPADALV